MKGPGAWYRAGWRWIFGEMCGAASNIELQRPLFLQVGVEIGGLEGVGNAGSCGNLNRFLNLRLRGIGSGIGLQADQAIMLGHNNNRRTTK